MVTKKLHHMYCSSDFLHENTWNEKRLSPSYNSALMIAKAHHIEHKFNDAPKFASALPSSAVEPKIYATMYCWPINVGTLWFC